MAYAENFPFGETIMFAFLNEGLFYNLTISESWHATLIEIGFVAAIIAISYFLGSINSAIIVSRLLYRDDIRTHGSGNAGLTNMFRTYGKGAAGLTLLGDMLKTALSVLFAACMFGFHYQAGVSLHYGGYIAGLFAVLGHVFPIYYKFKGGKGVLATATMALILAPIPFLILFALFVAIVAVSKYISLGSVSVAILYPVVVNGYFQLVLSNPPHGISTLCMILLAIFIVWCHRENLKRISNKTENKFSFKKKEKAEEKKPQESDDDE